MAPETLSLAGMRQPFQAAVHNAIAQGQHLTLVFHPWLLVQDAQRLKILFELYEQEAGSPYLWVAPCLDVARWPIGNHSRCW